jgi:K+ transporter
LELDRDDASYLSADPKIEVSHASNRFSPWRRQVFIALSHVAHTLPDELEIRAERRIGVGVRVAL